MSNYADLKGKNLQLTESLITNAITSAEATTDLAIGNNLTTGSVNIGSALSTTKLNGTATATTVATATDSSTNIATTAFVQGLKAIANTWALLQTFTNGIVTSSIQSLTSTTVMNIGTNLTGGTFLNIGPNFTGGTSVFINGLLTINQVATNSINIGNTTGGTIHIKSKTINLQAEAPTDNLKQLTIGGTSGAFDSNTTMNGLTTITKLFTDALQASSLSGISNIFTTKTAGGVTNIGSSASTVNLNGTVTAPTVATATDSSTNIATTAFVQGLKATANTWALGQIFSSGMSCALYNSTNSSTGIQIGSNLTGGNGVLIQGQNTTASNHTINGRLDINPFNSSNSINLGTVTGGTTHLKSLTNNIGAETQTTNNGVINIGQTTGAFDTTTNLQGKTTIKKPLIIDYTKPVRDLTTANLSTIGGTAQIITASFTIGTTLLPQSCTGSALPSNGRFLFSVFLYIPPEGEVGGIVTKVLYSNGTFWNGFTGGLVIGTDSQCENYGYKPTNTLAYSIQSTSIIDSGLTYVYYGIGCQSAVSTTGCKLVLNITRIG